MEQRTEEWLAARLGKVTASRVKDVMAKGRGKEPSATRKNYMMELLCERLTGSRAEGFSSSAMLRGPELEPVARSAYEIAKGVMVDEVGLILHPSIDGFGASPDGLVGSDGLIEIKCPYTATHVGTLQSGRHDSQYDWQMIAQMACTGRDWCDFVSFDDRLPEPLQYVCFRFDRDESRINEMEAEIRAFLEELAELERDMRSRMNG